MSQIIKTILFSWYQANHRDLPWRKTTNPYFIWLSEIILQQTRVQQGLSYYHRFTTRFPTVYDLANAEEQEILNLWQGLGYYSRARNLHATAKIIVEKYKGVFPSKFDEIIKLKGIGNYTAAAISSFAFNEPNAVLDGNVYRVISRLFNEKTAIDSTQGQKLFQRLADELLNTHSPSIHNQAIMEFGATQCVPVNPDCSQCVLNEYCLGLRFKTVSTLPYKEKRTKVKPISINYMVFQKDYEILLKKRLGKGIWQHLYEFPHLSDCSDLSPISRQTHLLSHQKLDLQYFIVQNLNNCMEEKGLQWVKLEEIHNYPKPKPIQDFINEYILDPAV